MTFIAGIAGIQSVPMFSALARCAGKRSAVAAHAGGGQQGVIYFRAAPYRRARMAGFAALRRWNVFDRVFPFLGQLAGAVMTDGACGRGLDL